ncbi:hypothetical protein [Curtobacterium flaccumfaciens]|uniref:hypothetical protein n=1 Tax=Curtobacterium flaccumfaciens TaxID=2035 RepID=UPI001BDE3CF8|nr:hypothetical protein [Curtobacterium flaccumfaciens]MBT1596814.1 hypothetical protein [Curtobacterium flaccumfaciens pv. flaccumfaciens]
MRARTVTRTLPDCLITLALYALARVVTTATLTVGFAFTDPVGFGDTADPKGFFERSTAWDGQYFLEIARQGYPSTLPVDDTGAVQQNAWAFLPVFPALVRAVSAAGGDPAVVAVLLATAFGGAASVALVALLRPHVGRTTALWSGVFFAFGPVSFVLQIAYAESLGLLLTFAALIAMQRRHYWTVLPIVTVLAFTRPGALAIPLALALHAVLRLVQRDAVPVRERVAIVVTGLVTAAAGLAWPVVAALVTGVPDAYLQTELAWWRLHLDVHHFAPLTPWFLQADRFAGTLGVVAVLVAVGATGWWLSSRSTRRIGSVPLLGSASYLLSLFATFLPQQSLPRLLLPAAPLLGAPLLHRTALRRGIVLGGCVLAQPAAVWVLFLTHNP